MVNRRFEEVIDQLADELMEEWRRLDALSPEEREAEEAAIAAQPMFSGPCLQAPARPKGGQ